MRSYGQYCGLARALDAIGDRWSMLIVRELLIRPRRYTDLRDALPGVATNLLAARLRDLQDAGLLVHEPDGRYRLTERGAALGPVQRELVRWAVPLMAEGQGDDVGRAHWLHGAVDALFTGADLEGLAPVRIVAEVEGEAVTIVVDGKAELRIGADPDPEVRITGSLEAVIGALSGMPGAPAAAVEGDVTALAALRGRALTPANAAASR